MSGTETSGTSDSAVENHVPVGAQPPTDVSPSSADPDLERLKIFAERYKAKLDFWKYVIVGGFVAAAIAAIPPVFQYATAKLEEAKSTAQLNADKETKEANRIAKQEEFRQEYVKLFLDKAVDQDIELRLRFAEYFAAVSAESLRAGWMSYRDRLETERQRIRDSINDLEREWVAASNDPNKKQVDIDEIDRKLAWAYKEVGYVERDRSVTTNPRSGGYFNGGNFNWNPYSHPYNNLYNLPPMYWGVPGGFGVGGTNNCGALTGCFGYGGIPGFGYGGIGGGSGDPPFPTLNSSQQESNGRNFS
jgi:hypothetical protein